MTVSWQRLGLLLLGILSTCYAQEFYVTVPDALRLDSDETIGIAIDGGNSILVNVNIQDHPGRIKTIAQVTADIKPSEPKIIKVHMYPSDFPPNFLSGPDAQKKVVIDVSSQNFKKSVVVPINIQAGYVFIQTDKPIYTPKQKVHFRIIRLNEEGLPSDKPFKLQIRNPDDFIVKEALFNTNRELQKHFTTLNYDFPAYPVIGEWTVTVLFGHEFQQNATIHFELQEYVLPTFTVELKTQDVILPSDDLIQATVSAKYVYGKNVKGMVTFRLGVKGETPEATFFAVIGPRMLQDDGSYTLKLSTDDMKRHKDVGWFPEIEGSHFIVEATVVDSASGNKEVEIDAKGRFSKSPFLISFKRCLRDFRPGLVSVFEADINYVDGKPAAEISTKITATADGKPLKLNKDSVISDQQGKVSFEIHPELDHDVLSITLETNDPRYEGSQAVNVFEQRKFNSLNKAYIAIDRTSGHKLKPEDMFTKLIHFEPEEISDTYYMVVSKGKILLMKKLPEGHFKIQRVEFQVTYDMVPDFRIIVFAQYKNELLADSLKIEVESKCDPKAEVRITPEFGIKEPGHVGKILIQGTKYTSVGLLGVDEAVYALSKKDLLTKSKIFNRFATHDLGCGPGGGLDVHSVLRNAGILIATKTYGPTADSSNSCVELKRRKRDIGDDILSSYTGMEKHCCALGMSQDSLNRNCQERTNIVVRYLKGEHAHCSKAFLECCLQAEERGFKDMKFRPRSRAGGDGVEEPNFIPIDEEEFFEKDLTVRTDFRETWIFEDISIGPDNKEEFGISLPHSITTWVIQAVSVSPSHGICIAEPQRLVSFKKVFLQLNLPYSVVRNEQVEIQATVFNYGEKRLSAIVYMYGVKDLCTGTQEGEKSERKRIIVEKESAQTATFPVIPLREGTFDIKVVALSSEGSDVIQRKLNVVPEGYTDEVDISVKLDPSNQQRRRKRHITTETYSDSIDPSQNLQVTVIKLNVPENLVPGTESCFISAIGDSYGPSVSTSIDNPDKLLQKPRGCGEQNMMFLAPTMYAMRYLKVTGKMTADIEEKGYEYMRVGYSNQLAFRKEDGSYAAYQNKPTSTWLTAFVMKVLCQANELVHIDENVLCSGVTWLVNNQQPDGSYIEIHPMYHLDMMGGVQGKTPMTAFTVIALEECKCNPQNLHLAKKRAVAYLEQNLGNVTTPLPTAIVAYSLAVSDSELKQAVHDKLLGMAKYDEEMNTLHWETENAAQDIETAGYALLTNLLFNDISRSASIVNWLNTKQLQSGSFKSTQDTVVALHALSEYAIRAQMPPVNLVANISSNNDRNFQKMMSFHQDNALVLQDAKLNKVGGMLFVKTSGHGVGSLGVKLRYNLFRSPEMICKFDIDVKVTEIKAKRDDDFPGRVIPRRIGVFENFPQDLIRGMEDALKEDPEAPVLDGDPRNRQRASLVAEVKKRRVKRQDADNNSMVKLNISVCTRYLGNKQSEMSIIDVGMFSGYSPEEEDLKQLQDDPNHLIQRYEKSSRGIVFYLQSIPTREAYCFDFRVKREYNVGNLHASVIKVYDYYNPDESCTKFYSPASNSPYLRTICEGGVCQCAEGGCPSRTPFSEVAKFEQEEKRERLKEIACENYDFVWKGKLKGEILREDGYYKIPFLIEEVIKEGIEKSDMIEEETRVLLARDNCESAWMHPDVTYLVLGKDGQKYENKDGQIWHRYLLDRTSIVYLWTEVKSANDRDLQRALDFVTRNLKRQGCDL